MKLIFGGKIRSWTLWGFYLGHSFYGRMQNENRTIFGKIQFEEGSAKRILGSVLCKDGQL